MKTIFSLIIFLTGSLFSQPNISFGENLMVFPEMYNEQKFPDAAATEDGTIHLVWVNVHGNWKDVMYSRSFDNGETFHEPVRIPQHPHDGVAHIQAGPKIRVRGDELLVVYMDDRSGYTSIYLNYSLDGGDSWSEDLLVSDQNFLKAYPELEVDANGTLHLSYYNFAQNYAFQDVRYTSAPSGSFEFSPSTVMGIASGNMEPCDCCQPDMVVSEDGDVYYAFRNNISNVRDTWMVTKPAGANDFIDPFPVSNYMDVITFCPSSGPTIAMDNETIAVSSMVYSTANSIVNISDMNDLSFDTEIELNPNDAIQNYPHIILENGIIHSAWVDYSNGNADMFYSNYHLQDGTESNPIMVNDTGADDNNTQKDPKLFVNDNRLFLFWSDDRSGAYQMYFAFSDLLMKGDVNLDGIVNVLDIITIINSILGPVNWTEEQLWAADMNDDGSVNVVDIVMIVNVILEN